ncbi:NAD(P)/FAD-dependent oxidoreductase [Brackiella oedipodis]|uniref:NAD(P)/FAD-dependent oxidoreductase n=1 Tax=Brackiella oedipodis TaxID=124225 RepID=UPI00048E5534|nr:NAD(P)/FAD-dependent oxidoreductase [Brackiella oedipodis]
MDYEVIIIGAGAAGVSCALWLKQLGVSALLLEVNAEVGGICAQNPFIDSWNALQSDMTGLETAKRLQATVEQWQLPLQTHSRVLRLDQQANQAGFRVQCQSHIFSAKFVVLASGVHFKRAESVQQLAPDSPVRQAIIVGASPALNKYDFRGKKVAVLGGGDNAFENAIRLLQQGHLESLQIFARHVRARQRFVAQIPNTMVQVGAYDFDAEHLRVNQQAFDVVLVFYGYEPTLAYAQHLPLKRDAKGYLIPDFSSCEMNIPNLYAIGELSQRQHPSVVTAMADGVCAAVAIARQAENLKH